ncbi:ABC transporter ATP-binding protein [Patescibacteria group bacterium]|nr:ABC transporter ATP-binding protein [Patescibacteria group bacterium]
MSSVLLKGIQKKYGNIVVSNIDYLKVKDGEFLTLLGPSGCGKTTILRIIAGLTREDKGEIYFGDRMVNDVPPERRNAAMVFQSYALFPHMNIYENIAFGLKMRKISEKEIAIKVKSGLKVVMLQGFEKRYPKQLSGGQQQRVAFARALVCNPDVLLLDEPLSNLDAKLREQMRFELKELQKRVEITSIYVTHDQAEALVLSDRIAVMHKGSIVQIGTPFEIYNSPQAKFVADFIGLASFIEGKVAQINKDNIIVITDDNLQIHCRGKAKKGDCVSIGIRPESIKTFKSEKREGINIFKGRIKHRAYLGASMDYQIEVGNWILRVITNPREMFNLGEEVKIQLEPDGCIAIPK